jgi:hypothetical protein
MEFLNREIARLENAQTTITDRAITIEGFICTVTARAEQMPNTWTVIGLLSFNGSFISFLFLTENKGSVSALTFTGAVVVSLLIFGLLK